MNGFTAEDVSLVRQGRAVLQSVNLGIGAGEVVALVGPNGAGKSTLLRSLAAELHPQQGRCRLEGLDVHRTAANVLARRRAVLPQDVSTDFPLIVEDVVSLGRAPWRRHASPDRNRRAVAEAAAAVGAGALMRRDYRDLSGGERQRVQLARVLAQIWDVHWDHEPRYLLLDEPTASLDVGHQQRLLTAVRQVLSQGIGVLAVLHDLNLAAAFADRIYLLDRGRVLTAGPPAAVIRAEHVNAVYAAELDVRPDPRTGRPLVLPCPPTTDAC